MRLSAVIITHNEERDIGRALDAVAFADERVVVDSLSDDRTVEICRARGARVLSRPFGGYGPQKRFAVEQAAHDWVLCVDADEVVDPELGAAIRAVLAGEVAEDVARCVRWLSDAGVPFEPALAYPFGAYPRKDPARLEAFSAALRGAGIAVAFRIGNRVNALPLPSPLEVERTEIRGDEPPWIFAWKVRRGRRKGFA